MSRVLLNDNGPQSVPSSEIEKLMAKEVNGLVSLETPPKFKPGDKVKSDELVGVLLVYEGMSSHERVKVLADLLGRKVPVYLPEKSLSAA